MEFIIIFTILATQAIIYQNLYKIKQHLTATTTTKLELSALEIETTKDSIEFTPLEIEQFLDFEAPTPATFFPLPEAENHTETPTEIAVRVKEAIDQIPAQSIPEAPTPTAPTTLLSSHTHLHPNPIPYYDLYKPMEIIQFLPKLTPLALNQVREYEYHNQKRAQILQRIDAIIRNNYKMLK